MPHPSLGSAAGTSPGPGVLSPSLSPLEPILSPSPTRPPDHLHRLCGLLPRDLTLKRISVKHIFESTFPEDMHKPCAPTKYSASSHLSICPQLNAFQLEDHLGRHRNAARWVPLLLAVHSQVTATHRMVHSCHSPLPTSCRLGAEPEAGSTPTSVPLSRNVPGTYV